MKKYLLSAKEAQETGRKNTTYRTFDTKLPALQQLINEALYILDNLGIPIEGKTARRLERMALAFLAVSDVKTSADWVHTKSLEEQYALKTRDIINYVNTHFGETLSPSSYDDIRRKDLNHLILANIVLSSHPQAAHNNPQRAWGLDPEYASLIKQYPEPQWRHKVKQFFESRTKLQQQLSQKREIPHIPITLPSGNQLNFGAGKHNLLQKAIVEEFLPRYGFGAQVIYVGDAENKFLHYDKSSAESIQLAELSHQELPGIVAYSPNKDWLYLIEAVHSSGSMSPERILSLRPFLKTCTASIIYITAFLERATFRKFIAHIAWETEVWLASEPDHLIHFNGEKFLGPYQETVLD